MPKTNQIYPNLPFDFRLKIKETRLKQKLSMRELGEALNYRSPAATVSQLEGGARNFSYERAVQFRDYLKMDYELPEPRPEEAKTITRQQKKFGPIETNRFYIVSNGELIEVLTYRKLGKIQNTPRISLDGQVWA